MKHTSILPSSSNAFALARPLPATGLPPRSRPMPRRGSVPAVRTTPAPLTVSPASGMHLGLAAALIVSGLAAYWAGALVMVMAGLFAAMLCTGFFVHNLRSSVKAVALAARRISAGDRSVRIPLSGAITDVDGLIESFNGMAAALDASERVRTQATVGVSHELRTPLTILIGRLHAIRDGVIAGCPGETERLLRQVENILRIVDDLDALAHADAGRLSLERTSVELQDIIRPVVADMQPLLAQRGLTIEGCYRRARVSGDQHRLRQVFTNILTNAAKHSPQGGCIRVVLDIRDGQAVASVIDEGPGIAPADLPHLFKPFWRSEASRRRPGCTGTGIGLALTESLVRAHGGHVEAGNRPDRSGALFRVVLPLA